MFGRKKRADDLEALNTLEVALASAKSGRTSMDAFLSELTKSQFCVPSSTEVQADGTGLTPVIHDREGVGMVAVFTDGSRIGQDYRKLAAYFLLVDAQWFIDMMPKDLGIVLQAGPLGGCELLPHALAGLRQSAG